MTRRTRPAARTAPIPSNSPIPVRLQKRRRGDPRSVSSPWFKNGLSRQLCVSDGTAMFLTEANVLQYLLARHFAVIEDVVAARYSVRDLSRRNRNYRVTCGSREYLVKQAKKNLISPAARRWNRRLPFAARHAPTRDSNRCAGLRPKRIPMIRRTRSSFSSFYPTTLPSQPCPSAFRPTRGVWWDAPWLSFTPRCVGQI